MTKPQPPIASSHGMTITDTRGNSVTDLVAGLASCLGHRHERIVAAVQRIAQSHLGSVADTQADDDAPAIADQFPGFASALPFASSSDANEYAFYLARSASVNARYRVITLLGSDHGDTIALRSASGRVDAQSVGPVVPGFRHVMPGDIDAMRKAIDPVTAAICIAPVDWNRGGEPFDSSYLEAVQSLCREQNLLFMIDETRIPPGVGGTLFFHGRSSAEPDIVTASAGWCGGLPGGLTLVRSPSVADVQRPQPPDVRLIRALILETAKTITKDKLLASIDETTDIWAATLDDLASGFDFVHRCVHAGLWTTIELDFPAADVAARARAGGLRIAVTGETTLLICPPLTATGEQLMEAIEPLRRTFEILERESTPAS